MSLRFDPSELPAGVPGDDVIPVARELESLAQAQQSAPAWDFAERVMEAVAREPVPTPARAFGAALLGGSPGRAVAALAVAWRIVGGSGRVVPATVRVQAIALLLVVSLAAAGGGSLAVAGAWRVLGPNGILFLLEQPSPTPVVPPTETPTPEATARPSPEATPSPSPAGSARPSETPEGSATPGAEDRPAAAVTPSAGGSPTPEATETPEPTFGATPSPSPSPSPTPGPTETP